MITVIRISGAVDLTKGDKETLDRLRLRRKYACVIIENNAVNKGMLKRVRNLVAYGDIDEETLKELVRKRAQPLNKVKKINFEEITAEILKNRSMKELEIKPFFRLHPPRKGINSKQHFPKGVLGNHKEKINELIRRML